MRLYRIALLAVTALLGACASIPQDAAQYSKAPAAPVGYATVYFYRVGALPRLRKPDVLISGVKIYEPPELSYTWTYVRSGPQKFRVEWAWDTGWPPVDFTEVVVPGESYYVKISGSFENKGFTGYKTVTHVLGSMARLVPRAEAEAELLSCCKYIKAEIERVP